MLLFLLAFGLSAFAVLLVLFEIKDCFIEKRQSDDLENKLKKAEEKNKQFDLVLPLVYEIELMNEAFNEMLNELSDKRKYCLRIRDEKSGRLGESVNLDSLFNEKIEKCSCPLCGKGYLKTKTITETFKYKGYEHKIPNYKIRECVICGEQIVPKETIDYTENDIREFHRRVDFKNQKTN